MANLFFGILIYIGIFGGGILLYLGIKSIFLKPSPTKEYKMVEGLTKSITILPVNYQYPESAYSYINPISGGLSGALIPWLGSDIKQYHIIGSYRVGSKSYDFEKYITHQNINIQNIFKGLTAKRDDKIEVYIDPINLNNYTIDQNQFYG